ncbi:hypothetical protein [Sphingobium sp. TKS]|uniref:hypothetical protein n=1 Tax=Sphingobium sp. TKS TaxID=1315974 RepID=UPI0008337035|nr:hypothetical protein [Sphingobium sp. TKS]
MEFFMTMQTNAKRSAASIKIIKRDPSDLIGGLRAMLDRLGPEVNKHDRADILIKACIGEGVNTASRIFEIAARLGFSHGHVPIRLKHGIGIHWTVDAVGVYKDLSG